MWSRASSVRGMMDRAELQMQFSQTSDAVIPDFSFKLAAGKCLPNKYAWQMAVTPAIY